MGYTELEYKVRVESLSISMLFFWYTPFILVYLNHANAFILVDVLVHGPLLLG